MRRWLRNNVFLLCYIIISALLCYNSINPATAQNIAPKPDTDAKLSILTTNYNKRLEPQEDIRNIPVASRIYDIGFVVYSKTFAERHGYSPQYITDLDSGMQALEFRVKSEGGFVVCYFNVLMDNSLGLDVPVQDITTHFERNGDMIRFPEKQSNAKDQESIEDKEFRLNVRQNRSGYYSRNFNLGSHEFRYPSKGTLSSLRLQEYTNKYFKGLDYFSLRVSCGRSTSKLMTIPNVSLWIKKSGGDDYTKIVWPKSEQFTKFRLPQDFTQRTRAILDQINDYYFLDQIEE